MARDQAREPHDDLHVHIVVTPEMIDAGLRVYMNWQADPDRPDSRVLLEDIYRHMFKASQRA
jgi:hypothetical protein